MTTGKASTAENGRDPVRAAIVAAARALFETNGYQGTRIMDIAAKAEVSYTSVYAKFESKRALYEHVTGHPPSADPLVAERATLRGRRTHAALLHEARRVFENQGFGQARVVDICDATGVSPATFYTYFPSKRQIFREIAVGIAKEMYERTDTPRPNGKDDDPVGLIREWNRRYLEAHAEYGRTLAVLDEAAIVDPALAGLRRALRTAFVQRGAADIRQLQQHGQAHGDLHPETTASALLAMLERCAQLWSDLREVRDPELELETVTSLFTRALGIPTAAQHEPPPAIQVPAEAPPSELPSVSG